MAPCHPTSGLQAGQRPVSRSYCRTARATSRPCSRSSRRSILLPPTAIRARRGARPPSSAASFWPFARATDLQCLDLPGGSVISLGHRFASDHLVDDSTHANSGLVRSDTDLRCIAMSNVGNNERLRLFKHDLVLLKCRLHGFLALRRKTWPVTEVLRPNPPVIRLAHGRGSGEVHRKRSTNHVLVKRVSTYEATFPRTCRWERNVRADFRFGAAAGCWAQTRRSVHL